MCCYELRDIPLDPITGSLASKYLTSSVIGGGPIYSVKMLRSTTLVTKLKNLNCDKNKKNSNGDKT